MLQGLRHWLVVNKLRRRRASVFKTFSKKVTAAKKTGAPPKEIGDIRLDELRELKLVDEERGLKESRRLTKLAGHYRIPIPQEENDWDVSAEYGKRFLTKEGALKLRAAVRIEQKAVWDYWQARISLVGSIMGIVGGIMGALAYFKPPIPPVP